MQHIEIIVSKKVHNHQSYSFELMTLESDISRIGLKTTIGMGQNEYVAWF